MSEEDDDDDGEEELVDFGPAPEALVDRRSVYRKLGERWYAIDLEDVQPRDLIAIVGDPELRPDDVQLWIVLEMPYTVDGRWTVRTRKAVAKKT